MSRTAKRCTLLYQIVVRNVYFIFSENLFLFFLRIKYVTCLTYSKKKSNKTDRMFGYLVQDQFYSVHYSYSILWSMEHTDCGNIIRTCPKNILVIILLCIRNIFLHVLPVSIFVSFFKDFDPVTVGQKFNLADVTASGTRKKMRYGKDLQATELGVGQCSTFGTNSNQRLPQNHPDHVFRFCTDPDRTNLCPERNSEQIRTLYALCVVSQYQPSKLVSYPFCSLFWSLGSLHGLVYQTGLHGKAGISNQSLRMPCFHGNISAFNFVVFFVPSRS